LPVKREKEEAELYNFNGQRRNFTVEDETGNKEVGRSRGTITTAERSFRPKDKGAATPQPRKPINLVFAL